MKRPRFPSLLAKGLSVAGKYIPLRKRMDVHNRTGTVAKLFS
jgi:hypothetical protein